MNHHLPPPLSDPASNPATALLADADTSEAVERLLRELLERLDPIPPPTREPRTSEPGNAVVLDFQMDGVAYKLLRSDTQQPPHRQMLSPREQEIVRLVAKGLPSKTIADVLDMSAWTVGSHLRRVFAKLGVSTRAEMVAQVLEAGLLDDRCGSESH